jgi:WD40 repeat protein
VTGLPESPYKGLAAFEDSELDALLFFGREREIAAVAANVLASRLTVLYGPSGVGKSSLLGAGVARRLREQSGAPVVFHDSWAEDPAARLIDSLHAECGDLGATAGLVDTVAAAAQRNGELHLLLDQFEEYLLYHGLEGPLSDALPELLRRPGLRVNVLLALRDDTLAELDEFAGRIPELFGNLLRLDRLDREAGRAAILGPLARYSELSGEQFAAEDSLVEAVLGEAETEAGVEAPYLQLVLERLWERERALGSRELRLSTFREIGGARAVVREHVRAAFARLPLAEQETAARVVRQLVTPSGRKVSHEPADLAEYADVEDDQLRRLLDTLGRERIVRGVNGMHGSPTRYEIFHDVLGPSILAWQTEHQVRRVRLRARRQRRRLLALTGATFVALAIVAAIAAYALVKRSDARTQTRHARGRELAARALAEIAVNPQVSVELALRGAKLAPSQDTADVLRTSLGAMRETGVLRLGGNIVAAAFAPRGDRLLVASNDGRLGLYDTSGHQVTVLPRQHGLTAASWSPDGRLFATGTEDGTVELWRADSAKQVRTISTGSPVVALSFARSTLLVGSGTHARLVDVQTGRTKAIGFRSGVLAAALDPAGQVFAVANRAGKNTTAALVSARTGRVVARLAESGIRSFAFSSDGRLLASGSRDSTARIWNARTGRLVHVLRHHGYVLGESFSPDGRSLVTSSQDGAGYVWDVASGQRELLLVDAGGGLEAATFSPDGNELATASADRLARIYYSQNGRLLAPLAGHGGLVTSVGFDPSGRTIVTGSTDGTARLWEALPPGTLRTIDTRRTPVQALFAGTDPVSVAGSTVRILTASGKVVNSWTVASPIVTAVARSDEVAFATQNGNAYVIRDAHYTVPDGDGVKAIALTDRGVVLAGGGQTVRAYSFGAELDPTGLVVHAGGRIAGIATGGDRFVVLLARQVKVYDDDGKLVSTIDTVTDHASLSSDGGTVATTKGEVAQLWSAATGDLLHTLAGHRSLVTDAEFSPDSHELVTVSDDHDGRIWSVRSGRLVRLLRGHFFPVRTGSYSPDGRWIVTASQFTAGLWNASTGQLMFLLGRDTKPLTGASFSRNGNWILTGSNDGTARVYHCVICRPLPGLEATAAARLHALR